MARPANPVLRRSANGRSSLFARLPGALRSHAGLSIGCSLATLLIMLAIFAPLITSSPSLIDPLSRLKGPSMAHWFGTDSVGRDLFSRVVYGARASMMVGMGASFSAIVVGVIVGVASGFFAKVDLVAMRVMDGLMAIPPILLAIALMTAMGSGVLTVIIAIAVAEVPRASRLVRSVTLVVKEEAYVQASITLGARPWQNIVRNIFPALFAPLVIHGTYVCGSAMLTESVLSFIGAGIPASIPTWGNIMADGRALWQIRPGMVLFPAAALTLSVLSINMIGDAVRDIMDPRYTS